MHMSDKANKPQTATDRTPSSATLAIWPVRPEYRRTQHRGWQQQSAIGIREGKTGVQQNMMQMIAIRAQRDCPLRIRRIMMPTISISGRPINQSAVTGRNAGSSSLCCEPNSTR